MAEPASTTRPLIAALRCTAALPLLPRRSWGWLALYLGACTTVLGALAASLIAYEGEIRHAAFAYIFPESWIPSAEFLVDRLFALQARDVLINAVLGLSLMLVTMTLFWAKELLSASYEKRAQLLDEPMRELSLAEQAWQETKLFALFCCAQAAIFWIGYGPDADRQSLARVLSYLVLFATYAIDFAAPIMQRHRGRYSRILKTLGKHPFACLLFGAIFALPPVIVGHLLIAETSWSWAYVVAALFAVNVVCITWAAVAGTYFGAQLFPTFRDTTRSSFGVRMLATVTVVSFLAANTYAFASIGMAVHHKSQLLKCDYEVDLASLGADSPSLDSLLRGEPSVGVHIDIVIDNPTEFDVEIENNRVVFAQNGQTVGTTRLAPMRIPAGESVRQRIRAELEIRLSALLRGRELLTTKGWTVVLYLEVAPGFEFPIYLLS